MGRTENKSVELNSISPAVRSVIILVVEYGSRKPVSYNMTNFLTDATIGRWAMYTVGYMKVNGPESTEVAIYEFSRPAFHQPFVVVPLKYRF
jgi:hypothetical protein